MAPEAEKLCANCGNTAVLQCSRCKNTIYCDANCQKAHWRGHKKTCNKVNLDRMVQRAGALLQKLFFIWRENTLSEQFVNIEETETRIYFQATHGPGSFKELPNNTFSSEETKEMVLSASMCAEHTANFSDILAKMFKGIPIEIRETTINLKEPEKMAQLFISSFMEKVCPPSPHNVFQITSRNPSKKWFLDSTGAQFGIFSPFHEAGDYMSKFGNRVTHIAPRGTARSGVDELCTIRGSIGEFHRARRDGARVVEQEIDKWCKEMGITLPQLLRCSEEEFHSLEAGLLVAVTKAAVDFAASYDNTAEVESAPTTGEYDYQTMLCISEKIRCMIAQFRV
ncbi:uncharacterized protein K460DRAFT_355769 [Cucurbitaria berberidis CBS 394.84]|uniref:MYND-type domain-containing protein n=1 Tax=Cucurbitaria berberidis CBS 394.84 TaxID=1168544 RepID=A0A9P4GIE9_9PLEO|nr:uncharacterized protein K460DRAFT_355769 [Cucurbitaria berberidis CBS 394.84]KAF1846044.1 hypothetical protein K460DRAFT_355769 [Cucurbitaria berberidis CBS 394.84]